MGTKRQDSPAGHWAAGAPAGPRPVPGAGGRAASGRAGSEKRCELTTDGGAPARSSANTSSANARPVIASPVPYRATAPYQLASVRGSGPPEASTAYRRSSAAAPRALSTGASRTRSTDRCSSAAASASVPEAGSPVAGRVPAPVPRPSSRDGPSVSRNRPCPPATAGSAPVPHPVSAPASAVSSGAGTPNSAAAASISCCRSPETAGTASRSAGRAPAPATATPSIPTTPTPTSATARRTALRTDRPPDVP